jgi:hypothetical protein
VNILWLENAAKNYLVISWSCTKGSVRWAKWRLLVAYLAMKSPTFNMRTVSEFSNVFPEELSDMPPDHKIEFVIELVPSTAPIFKRPYRMAVPLIN